jgi:hypothetical protein
MRDDGRERLSSATAFSILAFTESMVQSGFFLSGSSATVFRRWGGLRGSRRQILVAGVEEKVTFDAVVMLASEAKVL